MKSRYELLDLVQLVCNTAHVVRLHLDLRNESLHQRAFIDLGVVDNLLDNLVIQLTVTGVFSTQWVAAHQRLIIGAKC